VGGGQEFERRSGTEAVAAIVGFGKAVELAVRDREVHTAKVMRLRERFLGGLGGFCLNGGGIPHIANMGFEGVSAEMLVMTLDREGVCASAGSACASLSLEPSHVLRAMGRSTEAVRFSFDPFLSEEEIDTAVGIVTRVVERLR
jgi:cysteine desulfurase